MGHFSSEKLHAHLSVAATLTRRDKICINEYSWAPTAHPHIVKKVDMDPGGHDPGFRGEIL